jgi:hypothetical protein
MHMNKSRTETLREGTFFSEVANADLVLGPDAEFVLRGRFQILDDQLCCCNPKHVHTMNSA